MYSVTQKLKHFVRHSSLLWKQPAVLRRVASGYFQALVLRRPVLRTVEVAVTPECNTLCEMCYASRIDRPDEQVMTPEEYGALWYQAKRLGAFSVIISGGEPTTRRDLLDVLEAFETGKSLVALVSNGIETERWLDKLWAAGLRTLHLSLDSTDPEVHDRVRRHEGNFDKTMRAIRKAKSLGMNTYISTVIFRNGLRKMDEMVAFAEREGIGIVFSLACPTGEKAGAEEYVITEEEWCYVQKKMAANPHIRSDWTINLSGRVECPGGREKVAISPYGEVTGCGMNFVSFGNVRQEPLEVIWRRMQSFPPFAARVPRCLIGSDPEYIRDYLLPLSEVSRLPVRIHDHPRHPRSFNSLDAS